MKLKRRSQRSQRFLLKSTDVSVVRIVSQEKQRSECSQIFHFTSSEVNHCGGCSHRFPFNSTEVKQPRKRSQRFPFNSCEVKQRREHSRRFHFNDSQKKTQ